MHLFLKRPKYANICNYNFLSDSAVSKITPDFTFLAASSSCSQNRHYKQFHNSAYDREQCFNGLGWICHTVDMPHGGYDAVKINRENFIEFNSIEIKSNLFESLNCWSCLKGEIELKLFWIYLNCNLEIKYFNFI